MKGKIIQSITPQQKMVAVNNRFGNTNIKGQQGSTRVLFDSIDLGSSTELRFFENAGSKQFPLTNIGAEGNRLNVGDTFVVQKIYFAVADLNAETGAITKINYGLSTISGLAVGEFSFQIANSQVIKQLPLSMFFGSLLNPTAVNQNDVAFETFTDIVIPPLLEYVLTVRLSQPVATANRRLYCFIEGSAGIIAPQTTF